MLIDKQVGRYHLSGSVVICTCCSWVLIMCTVTRTRQSVKKALSLIPDIAKLLLKSVYTNTNSMQRSL